MAQLSIEKDYLKLFNTAKEMTVYFDVDVHKGTIEIYNKKGYYLAEQDLMFTLDYGDGVF